ncbi:MAG: hypothetical protein IT384_02650 [Deltaproteobacteria bacterium]|nr:hypothetical protein [Deltaproteobacteria bacterium]
MSRVGENSDEQRIREMQETELRQRADQEKRTDQERVTKSFQEVMAQRAQREQAKQTTRKEGEKGAAEQGGREDPKNASRNLKGRPGADTRSAETLQRRAAMAHALQGSLTGARSTMGSEVRKAESERVTDLSRKGDEEKERVDRDRDREDVREARSDLQRKEEQQSLDRTAVDPDDRRREDRGQDRKGDGQGEQPRGEGVAKADGPRPSQQMTRIPPEIIEALAKQIQVALAADGRTELAIALKGSLFDGVTLHVSAKKGKVKCTFEGCDKQLSNLIEASKGDLMRQLSKRGLELEILRAR